MFGNGGFIDKGILYFLNDVLGLHTICTRDESLHISCVVRGGAVAEAVDFSPPDLTRDEVQWSVHFSQLIYVP